MTVIAPLFDLLLVGALLWAAARALASENLLTGVALFVAFGLLMTLAWVRLAAPDVALAEAGIGTGFSGALFLAAIARLRRAAARRAAGSVVTEREAAGTNDEDTRGGDDGA